MNLLVISYYYPPMREVGGKRFFFLKQEFEKLGHSVSILCSRAGQEDDNLPNVYRTRRLWFNNSQRKDIISKALRKIWNRIAVIDPFVDWLVLSLPMLVKILVNERIDTVIITGPPFSLFFHLLVAKMLNKKVILDYRDPWFAYDIKRNNGSKIKVMLNQRCERKILLLANGVVLNTPIAHKLYDEWAPFIKNKSYSISNGIESVPSSDDRTNYKDGPFSVIYAGNLYGNRRLCYIFDALDWAFSSGVISKHNFRFEVYGKLTKQDRDAIINREWTSYFVEHDFVNHEEMKLRLKEANMLYIVQGEDFKYSIPYKLYDYIQTGKSVLCVTSCGSATHMLLNDLGLKWVGYIDDPQSIRVALLNSMQDESAADASRVSELLWVNKSWQYQAVLEEVDNGS